MSHRRTAAKRFVTDGRVLGEIDQLQETLRLARIAEQMNPPGLDSEVDRLEARLFELSVQAAEESLELIVEAIPGEEFDELSRQHPPSAHQLERYREQVKSAPWTDMPQMNSQTMAPPLLAACLVEPQWSLSECEEFWKGLSKGEQTRVWNWLQKLNDSGADLPFFNAATATTTDGGALSTTPANGASPSQSS